MMSQRATTSHLLSTVQINAIGQQIKFTTLEKAIARFQRSAIMSVRNLQQEIGD